MNVMAPKTRKRLASSTSQLVCAATISALLLTAGCQSDVDSVAKDIGKTNIKAPSSSVDESYGDRGVEITLLVPKGGDGLYDGPARDVRDGAAMAVGDVGNQQVFVKVIDVSAGVDAARSAVDAARTRQSALLVGYAAPDIIKAVADVPADQRPALLNLTGYASGGKVFNLAPDEIGSAVESVKAAVANKHKKVMVFAESSFSAQNEARLAKALGDAGATLVGVERYQLNDASASAAVQKASVKLQQSDTVVIMGTTLVTTTVVGAIKASGRSEVAFIGTDGWPKQAYKSPAANGTLIATPDAEGTAMISARYQNRYQRQLTESAAYGYDAVAIVSGIVRTKGPEGLTDSNLTNKTGFRGVTGLFRLKSDGSIERRYSLGMIENGQFKELRPSPLAF